MFSDINDVVKLNPGVKHRGFLLYLRAGIGFCKGETSIFAVLF